MKCPYCYEKMDKYSKVCNVCGFKVSQLDSASNALVKKMRKKDPESIIYVTKVPSDLNQRKLFWLALFGGMIGLPSFYVKKRARGIISVIGTSILLLGTPFVQIFEIVTGNTFFTSLVGISGAISFYIWIVDFVKIVIGRYKIPVVLKDRV